MCIQSTEREKTSIQRFTSPPKDYAYEAGGRHRQGEVPPVTNQVCQQGQDHDPQAPRQAGDGAHECSMLHVGPLNTLSRSAKNGPRLAPLDALSQKTTGHNLCPAVMCLKRSSRQET